MSESPNSYFDVILTLVNLATWEKSKAVDTIIDGNFV